jgi:hypothetical protein
MQREFDLWCFAKRHGHGTVALSALLLCAFTADCVGGEFCFGFFELRNGVPYAVEGEVWTFDHRGTDALEGWRGTHLYGPDDLDVIRQQTIDDFVADGLPPGAPIIDGQGMIWAGVHQPEADSLCYLCGLGYGTRWSKRMVSPLLPYSGGDVTLSLQYWVEMNPHNQWVDRLEYRIKTEDGYEVFDQSKDGIQGSWESPKTEVHQIPESDFFVGGGYPDSVVVMVIVHSSSGETDENCEGSFDSQFGAFGVDNIELSGGVAAAFDFEDGDQGWRVELHPFGPPGIHLDVHHLGDYDYGWEEWPDCPLEANVLTFHDQETSFSDLFSEAAISPIIDLSSLGLVTLESATLLVQDLEDYEFPLNPGIEWQVYVRYYPDTCSVNSRIMWSDWDYMFGEIAGGEQECESHQIDLLPGLRGIPDSIQVAIRVVVCRGCHGIDDAPSNASPVFDNMQVCVDGLAAASLEESPWINLDSRLSYRMGPNPLMRRSVLELEVLDGSLPVEISLHGLSGRRIATLLSEVLASGRHRYPLGLWVQGGELPGACSRRLGSGIWFVRVETPSEIRVSKFLVIR